MKDEEDEETGTVMSHEEIKEVERDRIASYWMKVENMECFEETAVFTVEAPVSEHRRSEVIEAKEKEVENLKKYGVFEEVEDMGQERMN